MNWNEISRITKGLIVTACGLLTGCGTGTGGIYTGPESPYAALYSGRRESARSHSHAEGKAVGMSWRFSRPFGQVWEGCMQVASQCAGIVGSVDDAPQGAKGLLVVHGQYIPEKVPLGYGYQGDVHKHMLYGPGPQPGQLWPVFVDVVIVVTARPISYEQSEVAVAWLSPETGRVEPVSSDLAEPLSMSELTRANYSTVCTKLNRAKMKLADPSVIKQSIAEKRELVKQVALNEFLQELSANLQGPEQWHRKFVE